MTNNPNQKKIGRAVGGGVCGSFFYIYKLTRNPYLTKNLFFSFFFLGGGGKGRGGG